MSGLNNITAKNNTLVPGLIVVCGPTATGKSGLAIALAKRLHSVILSADSRQVYREFNIGTAKPSLSQQQEVPHYLIDICNPTETLTVAEYQQQAQELIEKGLGAKPEVRGQESEVGSQASEGAGKQEECLLPVARHLLPSFRTQNSKPKTPSPSPHHSITPFPLLVGGTGLYIKSIVRGMKIPRVPPQPELRSQLQSLGQHQCYAMLQQVDPTSAAKIHPNDTVRTLRSLEVFYTTGYPISEQQGEAPPTYPILQIGLDCDSAALQHRIKQRTEQMVESGLVEEVECLCQKYGVDLPLLNTLGYAEFKQYLVGEISLNEAKALTVLHTRQFAKRQRTWFRADPNIEWFDSEDPNLVENVGKRIEPFIEKILFYQH
ncbi:tRNA (adenosine(37)-N6)-dimethylallyltransferase MiaA [Leptothermofonsia sp. ETS-13]|uniref:tRNA (adenosine(37)-N6)-dimethylallyltransferase MiaA n=1 Tax=Leptothermofonsia sp. ETS-13 TaxID=3035696 RepID=UPI003B9E5282